MVVFGGKSSTTGYSDCYELTIGATFNWRQLSTSGAPAAVRWQHTAMADPSQHRMLILGGNGTSDLRSLTWTPGSPPPSISAVSPTSAHEGDLVNIVGNQLLSVTGVSFNGVPAVIQSNTGTVITVQVPIGATTGPLTLMTPSGVVNAPANFVILYSPAIFSFTPTSGLAGADVTITGRLFSNVSQVIFGSGQPAPFTITSDTEVHATVNASATSGPILMTNSNGTTASSTPFTVIYAVPTVTSITPTSGRVGTLVTIAGQFLSSVTGVSFTGDNGAVFTIISDSEIQATVSPTAQTGPIALTSPSGNTHTPVFTVLRFPPVIASVFPTSARRGETVTLTGQYFSTATRVAFGASTNASFAIVSDTEIRATIGPDGSTGQILVANPDGATLSSFIFQVLLFPPVIVSATPSVAKPGATVVITGSRFTGTTGVSFGANSRAGFVIVSDGEIDARVDGAATTGPIVVTNGDGTTTSGFTFTVLPPDGRPTIVTVRDVPNDQGGRVILEWLASNFDGGSLSTITDYRIWRRAPLTGASSQKPGEFTSFPGGFWEPIGDVPAVRFPGYAFTAPTVRDSMPDSNLLTSFMVEALTTDPATYYFSDPDSGYSVDNLAPPFSASLVATYSSGGARLTWSASAAPDLAAYLVYRGSADGFAADSSHLVVSTTDTTYEDRAGGQAYELVAVDIHGNRSRPAVVSPAHPSAALLRTEAPITQSHLIRVSWVADDQPLMPAVLYRRSAGSEWTRLADLAASASGVLSYDDHAVEPNRSYDYRMGVQDAGAEVFLGEVTALAAPPHLAIRGIRPNPSVGGSCTVDLELLSDQPARLELLDVTGRRVLEQDLAMPAPGLRSVPFAPRGVLHSGIYFVRVHQAGGSGTLRLVVLD